MSKRSPLPPDVDAATLSNGHPRKLVTLLDYHERRAAAIRLVLGMLDEHATTASTKRAGSTITTAIALDAARRATTKRPIRRRPGEWAAKKKADRHTTAERLATFDRVEPRPVPDGAPPSFVGVLVQHGYLKRKGTGYLRTAKPFEP